ncbi:MAG: helix-turn-helix domain-containing protein [Sphingomonas bacterium]
MNEESTVASQDSFDDSLCPISRSSQLIGDRWTLLVLRELSMGNVRFDPLLVQTGASPQMLASRLKRITVNGLAKRVAYQSRPVRYEYRLTQKGWAFTSVLLALRAWGETWCKTRGESLAILTRHRECGGEVDLDGHCESCGQVVTGAALLVVPSPDYAAERSRRAQSRRTIAS